MALVRRFGPVLVVLLWALATRAFWQHATHLSARRCGGTARRGGGLTRSTPLCGVADERGSLEELTALETTTCMNLLPSISALTFFETSGAVPAALLRTRAQIIVAANPWLGGTLRRRGLPAAESARQSTERRFNRVSRTRGTDSGKRSNYS